MLQSFPNLGIKLESPHADTFLTTDPPGKPTYTSHICFSLLTFVPKGYMTVILAKKASELRGQGNWGSRYLNMCAPSPNITCVGLPSSSMLPPQPPHSPSPHSLPDFVAVQMKFHSNDQIKTS